jgi:hypothetical protein
MEGGSSVSEVVPLAVQTSMTFKHAAEGNLPVLRSPTGRTPVCAASQSDTILVDTIPLVRLLKLEAAIFRLDGAASDR